MRTLQKAAVPPEELAAVFTPVVRVYLLALGAYYSLITLIHPAIEVGMARVALTGLAAIAALVGLGVGLRLNRARPNLPQLEMIAATANVLMLANVTTYFSIHFEAHKLVYFVIMALCFATTAPTRRLVYASVGTSLACLLLTASHTTAQIRDQYLYIALAASFGAVGIAMIMRGAVTREIGARVAAEELTRRLEAELERNETLRLTAQELAVSERAANRTKSEFLATITHELRTPLNGVLGMAQVMALDELSDAQRQRLATIQTSGRALLSTINDVLDISKIEAGKLQLSEALFDLGRLCDELEALYRSLAQERKLTLKFEVDPAVRGWRQGDATRLRQVMSNLISNALKFTEEGSVSVFVRGDAEGLRVSVADTGIGIPPEHAPHLFEKFVQADASTTRRFGGTGLGLAICREIVGLMGGDIDFTSAPGEGSCFTFQVPAPAVRAEGDDHALPADLSRVRVLVVDDNPTNRAVARTLLAEFGVQIETADDGAAAVAAWETEVFDLILMDLHMPGMDGLEATSKIRGRETATGRTRTPIVALTASAPGRELGECLAAGMDGFVPKPIELSRLLTAVHAALSQDRGEVRRALAS